MTPNSIIEGAPIAFIVDTPSANDVVSKVLMSDKQGLALKNMIAGAGIDYTKCSFLSVVQERHTRVQYITDKERFAWEQLLVRELERAKPRVIVAVGDLAFKSVSYATNTEKYRGTPCECKHSDAIVIPLEHQNLFFSSPAWQPLTAFYLQKIKEYSNLPRGEWPCKEIDTIVTRDLETLEEEFLSEEYLNNPDSVLAFDIESSSAEMTCIGFAKEEDRAFVLPLVHMPMSEFVPAIRLIDKILRSPVKKIAQNGNFDTVYLGYKYKVKVENFWWDTMLCWHSIFPNLPKGIDTISSVCTDEQYWKDDGKQWMLPYDQVNWPQFFEYNGRDTANLITIQKNEKGLLDARGTWKTFEREMALCYPLVCMELDGIQINQEKVAELKEETGDLIRRWQLFLDTYLGEDAINVASPKQMQELLYSKRKLPKRVRGGKVTTDVDALHSLIPFDPVLMKAILILKKLKKEYSEYKVPVNTDGKMRSTFKPAGTETGRLASSKSITGSGTNFQNRTKKIRVYFEPDNEDWVLVNIDYSKAESWITMALAEDEKMLAALEGPDFHSENASNILGKPVTKANYSDRQLGKRVSHGANYRMTPFLLQKVLLKDGYNVSKSEAGELMEMYHASYPNIRRVFHARIEKQLNKDRTLVNPYERKITFYGLWNNDMLNSATAWIPQGTVGDMTNTGLINIYQRVPEARLKIQVHDSVVFQVRKRDLCQELVDKLSDCMLQELTINGLTFTIPIDIECGPNWLDLVDWKEYKANI